MAQACFAKTNRLVRIRMLGGVGGVPGNRAPIPIDLLSHVCRAIQSTIGTIVPSRTSASESVPRPVLIIQISSPSRISSVGMYASRQVFKNS